ncbi:hypothetical protein ACJMK2_037524 [Sinanodonta woodiana]|uniref:Uncharacterized protein n=1 Tax=Sinanodonta woodiana TaxID=1069815 RepID=A0ABD3WMQ7_SINWO
MEGKLLDETIDNDFTVQPYMYEPMLANNEEEAESSDSESDEINSEQHRNDEVLVNKRLAAYQYSTTNLKVYMLTCTTKHENMSRFIFELIR